MEVTFVFLIQYYSWSHQRSCTDDGVIEESKLYIYAQKGRMGRSIVATLRERYFANW